MHLIDVSFYPHRVLLQEPSGQVTYSPLQYRSAACFGDIFIGRAS